MPVQVVRGVCIVRIVDGSILLIRNLLLHVHLAVEIPCSGHPIRAMRHSNDRFACICVSTEPFLGFALAFELDPAEQ